MIKEREKHKHKEKNNIIFYFLNGTSTAEKYHVRNDKFI